MLLPFLISLVVAIAAAAFYAPRMGDPLRWLPFVAGAAIPLWFGHRAGLWRVTLDVLRGRPSPRWRVEVGELEIRETHESQSERSFEWFEIERFNDVALGIVLWLRLPKNGANAIILPRRFFRSEEWAPLVSLVREKLPSSAKANDEAKRTSDVVRRNRTKRTLLLWALLVAMMTGIWFLVREPR